MIYSPHISQLLSEIDSLKEELNSKKPFHQAQLDNLNNYFNVEYTYSSNKIEGNTLTHQETAFVIEKGLTIAGKQFREHLEAVNHYEAISYINEIVKNKEELTPFILKDIHRLILKNIDSENAGIYRKINVFITGSKHIPPDYFLINDMMEQYFEFYKKNKNVLHPVILAAEMHERLVSIHPFVDGNGRTSRLIMNLILLQKDYPLIRIQGELENRIEY